MIHTLTMRNISTTIAVAAFILAAVLSSGCGQPGFPPDTGVLVLDMPLLPACEQARDRWYEATGIVLACDEGRPLYFGEMHSKCAAGETGEHLVRIRDRPNPECPELLTGQPDWPDAYPEAMLNIVAHEIGHVLAGYRNGTHAEDGLMARSVRDESIITTSTLEWLCETAPCRWLEEE